MRPSNARCLPESVFPSWSAEVHMLRSVLAVVAAAVAWMVVATLLNLAIRYGWAEYAAVEQSMSFTLPMLLLRLLVGAAASFGSGFAGALVSKGNRMPIYVFAILLLALFLPVHYGLWARFPVWYHLFFLASLLVFPVVGAMSHLRVSGTPQASK